LGVMLSFKMMSVCDVRMMACRFVIAFLVIPGGFFVMFRRMFVMLGCFFVMFRAFVFRHL